MKRKTLVALAVALSLSSIDAAAQLTVGHRGSLWGVENTRAAFINGANAGAWGLECDIHLTKDGAFVVCHDSNMKRLGGPDTPFSQMNVDEALATPLTQKRDGVTYTGNLMTLGEFLDLCHEYGKAPVIEIKYSECRTIHADENHPEATNYDGLPMLMNLIKQKGLADKAVIISFMPEVVEHIREQYPDCAVQVLVGANDGDPMEWLRWCKKRKIDLDINHELVTPELVDGVHKAGLKINVWTVDDESVHERMKQLGVDFITTNALFPQKPQ